MPEKNNAGDSSADRRSGANNSHPKIARKAEYADSNKAAGSHA